MNTKAFLRDWQPGDVLTADELNAIAEVIAMLEAAEPGGGGGAGIKGGKRVISDGPLEMPWQVYTVQANSAIELRVIPGAVFIGTWNGSDRNTAQFATLPAGGEIVQNFDPATACTVWLELTGEVSVKRTDEWGATPSAGLTAARWSRAELSNAALQLTLTPSATALRVWPLAVYNPAHAQRVTQLLWGDLSALECRGLIDSSGVVVWPKDRSSAAAWNTEAHREGMATMCELDFSRESETVTGVLSACIDEDGALEFFLGATQEEAVDDATDDDDDDAWGGDIDVDDDDDDDGGGGWSDVYDDNYTDNDDDGKGGGGGGGSGGGSSGGGSDGGGGGGSSGTTKVKYGYVAGKGFKSCTYSTDGNGNYKWKLELDPSYLAGLLKNIEAKGTVSFSASGSSPGIWATVSMSLGDCSASASGVSATGSAGLKFKGTAGSEGSATATAKITYKASPSWTQPQTWLLSADSLASAGTYVKREKGTYSGGGFIEARHWYRFSVNESSFKKHAQNYFKAEMAKITVSDSDSSTSSDSTVTGTLSGTILNPSFSLTLS